MNVATKVLALHLSLVGCGGKKEPDCASVGRTVATLEIEAKYGDKAQFMAERERGAVIARWTSKCEQDRFPADVRRCLSGAKTMTDAVACEPSIDTQSSRAASGGNALSTRWIQAVQGIGDQYAKAIVLAPDGDVLAAGYFSDTAAIGTTTLKSAGSQDIWLARFAPQGSPRWAIRLGGEEREILTALSVTSQGAVVVGLRYEGEPPDFGEGLGYARHVKDAGISRPMVLVTVAADGSQPRVSALPIEGAAEGIAALPDGGLLVTSRAKRTTVRDCGQSAFVAARLRADGSIAWSKCSDGGASFTSMDGLTRVSTTPDGGVAMCGSFSGRLGWAGERSATKPDDQQWSAFVASLDPEGKFRWIRYAYGQLECHGLAVSRDGAVSALFLSDPSQSVDVVGAKSRGAAIGTWSSNGELQWLRSCDEAVGVEQCRFSSLTSSGDRLAVAAQAGGSGVIAELDGLGKLHGEARRFPKDILETRIVGLQDGAYAFADAPAGIDTIGPFGKWNAHVGVFEPVKPGARDRP